MSDSVRPHRRQPTRLPHPWDSPGKNTGMGCHFLLQCMKVKSQSEVAQSCPTLSDPMDCGPPGSSPSIHKIFPGKGTEVGCHCLFLNSVLKRRDITLLTKVRIVNYSHGFSSSRVWMWELDHKESWVPRKWCFWTVVLEKTLESPLDYNEIKPVHPKGNKSWILFGRTDAEAEAPILWPLDAKNWLVGKDPDAGQGWRQEEKGMTKDEMVGWCHRLDEHEFEQGLGVVVMARKAWCAAVHGVSKSQMQLSNWTKLNWSEGNGEILMGWAKLQKERTLKNVPKC